MLSWMARPFLSVLRSDARHFSRTIIARAPKGSFWPANNPQFNSHLLSSPPVNSAQHELGKFLSTTVDTTKNTMLINQGTRGQTKRPPSSTDELLQEVWDTREKNAVKYLPRPHTTYSGRSILAERDFTMAFRQLQRTLAENSFVYELRLAERHEKKGAKRRRLASERWRRRFAHEVRKKVQLVNEIRARGA